MALCKKRVKLAGSRTIHGVTLGGSAGNCKRIKINKTRVTLKVKKTFAYETSNKQVAKVSSTGKIKAVGKGKCKVYVYAQNGKYKTVYVTVK